MKKIFLLFMFINLILLLLSAKYDIFIELQPEQYRVHGIVSVEINDEDPHFVLWPNFDKTDIPELHSLLEGKGKTKIEIISITDKNNNSLDYRLSEIPSNKFIGKSSLKESLLIVDTDEKIINIEFYTYFSKELSPDNYSSKDFFIWRFGWYPQLIDYNKPFALTPHEWKIHPIYPDNWIYVGGGENDSNNPNQYYSNGKYSSNPLIFLEKESFDNFTIKGNNTSSTIWFRKGLHHKASSINSYAQYVLDLYDDIFGELRYSNVNIVHSPYPAAMGMASDGVIILADTFFTTADLLLPGLLDYLTFYLVAHELAHLWFGIGTPVDFSTDNFISESLAEYASLISMFEFYGHDKLLNTKLPDILVSIFSDDFNTWRLNDQAMIFDSYYYNINAAPSFNSNEIPINFQQTYYYNLGRRALFQIEDYIGRDELVSILREFYLDSYGNLVGKKEFFNLLNRKISDEIIYDLFENPEHFDASVRKDRNNFIIDMNKNLPVTIEINRDGEIERKVIVGSQVIEANNIKSIIIDPDYNSTDVYRFNNYYPRRFDFSFGDSDYSIFDAYFIEPYFDFDFDLDFDNFQNTVIYSELAISKYPYWNISAGTKYNLNNFFETAAILFGVRYNPNPWISLTSRWEQNDFLYGNITYRLPSNIDIGMASPLYSYKYSFQLDGLFQNLDNYRIGFGFDLNELYNYGIISNSRYYLENQENILFHRLKNNSVYFFNTKWFFQPSIETQALYSTIPYYKALSDHFTIFEEDRLFDFFDNEANLIIEGKISLSTSLLSRWRTNIFNLLSFQGVHLTLETGYKNISGINYDNYSNLFEASIIVSPKFYFLMDMPLTIPIKMSLLYSPDLEPVNRISFSYSFSTSLGTSIYNQIK